MVAATLPTGTFYKATKMPTLQNCWRLKIKIMWNDEDVCYERIYLFLTGGWSSSFNQ